MKTTDKSYPVGLANLLAGKPATTTKETKVSTTTKARKHTTKPSPLKCLPKLLKSRRLLPT